MGAFAGPGFGPGVNRPVKTTSGFNAKIAGPGGRIIDSQAFYKVFGFRMKATQSMKDQSLAVIFTPAEAQDTGYGHLQKPASATLKQQFSVRRVFVSPGFQAALKIRRVRQLVEVYRAYKGWRATKENDEE